MKNFLRKNNRLPAKAIYRGNNYYFVTICVQNKTCIFDILGDDITNNKQNGDTANNKLNGDAIIYGQNGDTVVAATIVKLSLLNLLDLYCDIMIDIWVIMPNHIHFIISLGGNPISKITKKPCDLGDIIKSFKLHSQKSLLAAMEHPTKTVAATTVSPSLSAPPLNMPKDFNYYKLWQKSFYDRIIRDEKELGMIRQYIKNNPVHWSLDSLNPSITKLNGDAIIYGQNGDTIINKLNVDAIINKQNGDTVVAATIKYD